jgi:hypothetical protein
MKTLLTLLAVIFGFMLSAAQAESSTASASLDRMQDLSHWHHHHHHHWWHHHHHHHW